MSELGKKLTVADLAKEVGVSPATISRVLNHSHLVNKATYDKVMATIDRLGYEIPEQRDFTLRKRSDSNIVAVNVASIDELNCPEYINGIQTSAYRYEWTPVLTQNPLNAHTIEAYLKTLQSMRAAGLILLNHTQTGILDQLSAELPVVQCGEFNEASSLPYVGIDDFDATRMAVSHLISRGARKIVFVNAPSRYHYAQVRRRGFEQALRNAGLEPDPSCIVSLSEPSFAMAHTFISPMLTFQDHPDAIFAANDTIAYAAIVAAKEQGLRVPEDISVIGFGNQDFSIMSTPKITTVSQPRFQLGFIACELLHEQWANQTMSTQNIILNTELIVRGSTK